MVVTIDWLVPGRLAACHWHRVPGWLGKGLCCITLVACKSVNSKYDLETIIFYSPGVRICCILMWTAYIGLYWHMLHYTICLLSHVKLCSCQEGNFQFLKFWRSEFSGSILSWPMDKRCTRFKRLLSPKSNQHFNRSLKKMRRKPKLLPNLSSLLCRSKRSICDTANPSAWY